MQRPWGRNFFGIFKDKQRDQCGENKCIRVIKGGDKFIKIAESGHIEHVGQVKNLEFASEWDKKLLEGFE